VAKAISRLSEASKATGTRGSGSADSRALPDLSSIMTHFNQALSPLILCQRSLVEVEEATHEESVLRDAIELLRRVYDEIDAAEQLIHRQ
jgi:hypothetical protein